MTEVRRGPGTVSITGVVMILLPVIAVIRRQRSIVGVDSITVGPGRDDLGDRVNAEAALNALIVDNGW
ncbi:MAG: hypothetical protein U5N53_09425 [Mycobacterium sp.]|nr:hypothetical protein [Mycobacterium sp.]